MCYNEFYEVMKLKKIGLLGATGSIGTQALEVIEERPDFTAAYITAHRNTSLLKDQIDKFSPKYAVITDNDSYKAFGTDRINETRILCGYDELYKLIASEEVDVVLNSLVGTSGLMPTYIAASNGIDLALANKESLVSAGHLITKLTKEKGGALLPVDSEHSAILQSLAGSEHAEIEKLILTASGGAFRDKTKEEIKNLDFKAALKHPNWSMGRKITIDSATLINKGLEVMEARWLFDISADDIEVLIHRESIVHSLVQYRDSSIMAQLGLPDMKLPIYYALDFPRRRMNSLKRMDFANYPSLTFEKPDLEKFPGLALSYEALKTGGSLPTVLNTVNEVMVERFLRGETNFYGITDAIELEMSRHRISANPSIEEIVEIDKEIKDRYRRIK